MEFESKSIETMKMLMWDYGLTKREAISYYSVVIDGKAVAQMARELNVSSSLITKRVKTAQEKIEHAVETKRETVS